MNIENQLLTNKHYFICVEEQLTEFINEYLSEIEFVKKNFCGIVLNNFNDLEKCDFNSIFYLCGDISENIKFFSNILNCKIQIITNISYNYNFENFQLIEIGKMPINIHNVGLFFRNYFDSRKNYFDLIEKSHEFQQLTESNKMTNSYRSGIYLSKVQEIDENEIKFNLLRCSTNFNGPTENFSEIDNLIISDVNYICENFFIEKIELNHVLAQIYSNKKSEETNYQEKKAKIKQHSDKTKDMPKTGLIAFCSFYKDYENNNFNELNEIKKSNNDNYDYNYKNTSVLTKLRFKLKKCVNNDELINQFDVILYPNSLFLISLKTNRLYTHEIVPSVLPISKIPTRMGYVIRCSNTEAIYKENQTWIIEDDNMIKMEETSLEKMNELKKFYYDENMTCDIINYKKFYFSMNEGDYKKPCI